MKLSFPCHYLWLIVCALVPLAGNAQLPAVPAPDENPITEQKRVLGKILFWEEQLSSDDSIACGSCHIPAAGGADPRQGTHPGFDGILGNADDIIGSPGIARQNAEGELINDAVFGLDVQVTGRAAPTNITAMFAEELFWDGRAQAEFFDPQNPSDTLIASGAALENQAIAPLLSDVEMAHEGRSWDEVIAKLAAATPLSLASNIPADMTAAITANPGGYPALFSMAFGDEAISAGRIAMALATYQRTLVADQSPWDLYMAGDTSAMTASQIAGWVDFSDNTVCDNCHVAPLFTDNAFHNIGLRPGAEDIGRQQVTALGGDLGRFKTPTLRNAGLKSSLMHVGFVTSVRDAIDFYNANADPVNGIANRHSQFAADQTGIPAGASTVDYDTLSMFSQSEERKAQVADFIANGLTDPRVANETFPFDRPTLASERVIKAMTYNVNSLNWSEARADLVAGVILSSAADVVSLQEAGAVTLPDLEARLSEDYEVFAFGEVSNNSNVLLVRRDKFIVADSGITDASAMLNCVRERYISHVVLQHLASGGYVSVYNSQFCSMLTTADNLPAGFSAEQVNEAHAQSLMALLAANEGLYPGAVLVAGDLNANTASATMAYLLEQQPLDGSVAAIDLDDNWAAVNASVKTGVDWILYVADSTQVLSTSFIDDADSQLASDHLPLVSEIRLEAAQAVIAAAAVADVAGITVQAGARDQVMLRFSLQSDDGQTAISSLRLQAGGSGDDSAGVSVVKITVDENGNGEIDASEPLLGQGVYSGDNGLLTVTLDAAFTLPVGISEFLVSYDF